MALEKLGKYKIVGKIGKGAMGEVFRAHDPVLNREVAVKTISASLSTDNDLRMRFHREAQAAARLNHPNIITVFDYGEEHGVIYMAMELLEGADLKDIIRQSLLTTLDEKLDVMEQVADGLAFAHSHEIIHRDLKPGNIHLQPNGQVKILDFGLARLGTSADMTRTGVVMGTPNYMAPEMVKGDRADTRADIFSIGAVFYEILTNRKPFDADSAHAVLFQVVHQAPKPLREWTPDVPPILVQLVEGALHKDKERRLKSGTELREALLLVRQALNAGRAATATLETEAALASAEGRPGGASYRSPGQKSGAGATMRPKSGPPRPAQPTDEMRAAPRAEMFTETRRPASRPPASRPPTLRPRPQAPSRAPLWIGLAVLVLAVAAGGGYLVSRPKPAAPSVAPTEDAKMAALSAVLVSTQLELAKRDLEDKNWTSAVTQAENALKLAPGNPAAQKVLDDAKAQIAAIDAAVAEARENVDKGDTQAATLALSRLLALDPKHPAAAELSTRLDRYFQSQATEARSFASESRAQAERAQAAASDTFAQALGLSRDADRLLGRGEYASATRGYLEARDAFDRARRAAEAKPLPTPPPRPAQRPEVPPATVVAATLPSAAPVTTAPAAVPPPVTAAPVPARALVAGATSVRAAKQPGKAPAGFDGGDVLADRDFLCKLGFEASPSEVRPGDSYQVTVYMVNDTARPIRMKTISLASVRNGDRSALPASAVKEAPPRAKTQLGGLGGVWLEGTTSWSLEAAVTSPKDDVCRARLTLK
jgi:eukaryotic-like serine/threonine-protein kinase